MKLRFILTNKRRLSDLKKKQKNVYFSILDITIFFKEDKNLILFKEVNIILKHQDINREALTVHNFEL